MIPLPSYCLPMIQRCTDLLSLNSLDVYLFSYLSLNYSLRKAYYFENRNFSASAVPGKRTGTVLTLNQYLHAQKFILRLFFKCCFHFFAFPTEQIASAIYCALQASISIEQGIPFSLYVARKQSFRPLLSVSSYWQSSLLSSLGLAWIIVGWVNYAYGYYTGEPECGNRQPWVSHHLTVLRAFIWPEASSS